MLTCCSGKSQTRRCPAPRWRCSSRGLWRRSFSPRWCHWFVPLSNRTVARTWPKDDTIWKQVHETNWLVNKCIAQGQRGWQHRWVIECVIMWVRLLFTAHSAGLETAYIHVLLHSLQPLSGVTTLWLMLVWISVNCSETIAKRLVKCHNPSPSAGCVFPSLCTAKYRESVVCSTARQQTNNM